MLVAMAMAAILCIGIGVFYQPLYAILPFASDYVPYTADHVITTTQLLMFSALAFTVLMRTGIYPPELHGVNLDSDWIYRRALPRAVDRVGATLVALSLRFRGEIARAGVAVSAVLGRSLSPSGWLGEPWPTGQTAMWAGILLCVYLVLYYI